LAGKCVIAIDWSVGAEVGDGVALGLGAVLGEAVGVDVDAGVGVPFGLLKRESQDANKTIAASATTADERAHRPRCLCMPVPPKWDERPV
jgi:hypothetical protein